ncbi:MAG: hypothetical protein ACI4SG_01730 [Oligosphaeraceae bacterium]
MRETNRVLDVDELNHAGLLGVIPFLNSGFELVLSGQRVHACCYSQFESTSSLEQLQKSPASARLDPLEQIQEALLEKESSRLC